MKTPIVTVMIATFNSSKLLPGTLDAIKNQTYPKNAIEILVVDGGSTDDTLEIAAKYGCRILHNEKTEPVNAKLMGLKYAAGKYLITIDHDEVMENPHSIEYKVKAIQHHPECKVVLCSGYKRPKSYPRLNQYISEFGDPFSLFIYNFPKGYKHLEEELRKNYKIEYESKSYMKITFDNMKKDPIFELCCLGTMIDRDYFLQIPGATESGKVMVHFFYEMIERGDTRVLMLKNDPLTHYSADSLKAYWPKLKWRICNNIHFSDMGDSGFTGRSQHQKDAKYRKFLFVPYTISIILPILDGIKLSLSRKNIVYMMHIVFCWYVLIQIVYQYSLKIVGKTPSFTSYDGKKKLK